MDHATLLQIVHQFVHTIPYLNSKRRPNRLIITLDDNTDWLEKLYQSVGFRSINYFGHLGGIVMATDDLFAAKQRYDNWRDIPGIQRIGG